MSARLNRREFLGSSLGAAGWIAAGGMQTLLAAEKSSIPMNRRDRSKEAPT
jgi:hypothetical protein